jgi:parallel beta-helix repeat protein
MKVLNGSKISLVIFGLIISFMMCTITHAATINVSKGEEYNFNSIQAGIDAAEYGDTVFVAPGIYYENITLKNGINLSGSGADITIIDANGYGDVVNAGINDATISGFTLRNSGEFDLGHTNCGVYISENDTPVIKNNFIVNNRIGVGVWHGANPDIRNNIIKNNSNGLYIYGSEESPSNPSIINNTIVNNEDNGITLRVMVSPVILNNIITGHTTGINHNYVTGLPLISYNNLWHNEVNYMRDNLADETLAGPGSISIDPCFAEPGYWADVNDPNIVVEPNNPNAIWIDSDYHLKSQAGRYNPNSQSRVMDDITSPCIDAGDPNSPVGDEPQPNGGRINIGAYGGTAQASMSLTDVTQIVYIQWFGHASVKVWSEEVVVYVDPWLLEESVHDATAVLVTHSHADHYSPSHIAMVSGPDTIFIAPPDVVQQHGSGQTIAPEQAIQLDGFSVTGVAAYNINKPNHPKSNNWVGYIIELGGKRIYLAGDTDLTEEIKAVENIDVAFLPVSGGFAMNATEAADATQYIQPQLAIPYHWGVFIGNLNDAETFAEQAACPVKIMSPGEIISSENWLE